MVENISVTLREVGSFLSILSGIKLPADHCLIIDVVDPGKKFKKLVPALKGKMHIPKSGDKISAGHIYIIKPGYNWEIKDNKLKRTRIPGPDYARKGSLKTDKSPSDISVSKNRFRVLVEHSTDAIVILDVSGKPTYASPSISHVLGYSEKEALQLNIRDIIHPDDVLLVNNALRKSLENPGVAVPGADARLRHKNGGWRWYAATITNMLHDPAINGIVDNFRDITEKKLSEQKLHDTLAILHDRIKQKNCLAQLASLNNKRIPLDELLKQALDIFVPVFEVYNGTGAAIHYQSETYKTVLYNPGNVFLFSERNISGGGTLTIKVSGGQNGKGKGKKTSAETDPFLENINDIIVSHVQQHLYLEQLTKSRNKLNTIVESEPECVKIVNRQGELLEMNPAGLSMLEIDDSREQIIGTKINRVIHPDDREVFNGLHEKALQGEKGSARFRVIGAKGTVKWLESGSVPMYSEDGSIESVLSVTRDISGIIEAEDSRNLLNLQLELLLSSTDEGIYGIDLQGACTFMNPAGAEMLGYTVAEIIGKNMHHLIHHTSREGNPYDENDCPIYKSKSSGTRVVIDEDIFYASDGRQIDVRYTSSPMVHEGKITGAVIVFKDISQKLKKEREILRLKNNQEALINGTMDLIWSVDTNLRLISFNKAYSDMIKTISGMGVQEGQPVIIEEFGEELVAKWRNIYKRGLSGESFSLRESVYNPMTNEMAYALLYFNPMYDNNGEVFGLACYSRNITEDTLLQLSLQQTKNRLQRIFNQSPDIICTLSISMSISSISNAVKNILGYEPDELAGRSISEIISPEDRQGSLEMFKNAAEGSEITNFENYMLHKNSKPVPVIWSIVFDHEEKQYYCITHDASGRKAAEMQIRLNEKRFKSLIQEGSDFIAILNNEFNFTYVSPAAGRILDLDSGSMEHHSILEYIHGEDKETVMSFLHSALENRRISTVPFRMKRAEDQWVWMEAVISNLFDDIAVDGIVINARDITIRVAAEATLKESENKYRLLFKSSPLPMWVYNPITFRILDVNESALVLYGYSAEEFLNMTIKELRPEEEIPKLLETHKQIKNTEGVLRFGLFIHKKKDGTRINVDISGHQFFYGGEARMMIVSNDVTEKEKALKALTENERRLAAALKIGKLGYWQFNVGNGSVYWSDEVFEIFGKEKSPVVTMKDLLNQIPREDRSEFLKKLTQARNEKKEFDFEQIIHSDVNEVKWLRFKGAPLNSADKNNTVFEGTVQDISELKVINQNLIEANTRFRLVMKASFDTIWDWNLLTDVVFWGDGLRQVFGYKLTGSESDVGIWKDNIHPDDREWVLADIYAAIKGNEANWISEYRFMKADGSVAYVSDKGFILRNRSGMALRMVGAMQDITRQKEELNRLKLYESIIQNTTDSVLITEGLPISKGNHRIIYVNDAFTEMTGYTFEDLEGKTPKILQGKDTDKNILNKFRVALEAREQVELTILNYKKNGEAFWNQLSMTPVFQPDGDPSHYVTISRDITIQKNEEIRNNLLALYSTVFSDTIPLKEMIDAVLFETLTATALPMVEIWLTDKTNYKLQLTGRKILSEPVGFSELPSTKVTELMFGEGLPGLVWKEAKPIHWSLFESDERFVRKDLAQTLGLERVSAYPMYTGGEIFGILLFGFSDTNFSFDIWSPFLETLAKQLAIEMRRKQLEIELKQLFETAPDVICIADADGYFKRINPAACELLGYTEHELLTTPLYNFIHPDDVKKAKQGMQSLSGGSPVQYFEARYITKSNKIKWLAWTSTPSPDTGLFYAIAKDITDKKELESLFEKAIGLARIGTWEVDLVENSIYWSDVTREIHEVAPDFVPDLATGINFYKEGYYRELITNCVQDGIAEGKPWDEELIIITAKGKEVWVRAIGEAEIINGNCIRLYGAFQDIDSRKRAENEIIKTLNEKNTILESIADAFLATDRNGIVTYWNGTAEKLLGIPKEVIIGKYLWDVFADAVGTPFYIYYFRALEENKVQHFEAHYPQIDIWFEVSAFPSEGGISAYFKDISERKAAEQEIRLSNERYNIVSGATNDTIWDWDLVSNEVNWSDGLEKQFGYSPGMQKTENKLWKNNLHPDDQQMVLDSVYAALSSGDTHHWECEYRFRRANGIYAYVLDRGKILRDQSGKAIRMVGAMQDITQRKEYEESLKKLNAELEKYASELKTSNAELEQFAYVASHDLQEPLRMITGFLAQIERKYTAQLDERGKKYIEFAVDGAKRMRHIILDLLEFSRVGRIDEKFESVNSGEVVAEVCELFRRQIEETNADVLVHELPTVVAPRIQLRQIFQNLIGNSLKYKKKDISPIIEIRAVEESTFWKFSVKDNGIGIDPEYFQKIFIIFQRLHNKDEYSGTGMGLAIAKKIIEGNGGTIWLESEEHVGSTFYFTIPKRKEM